MNPVWTIDYFLETDEIIKWFESLEEEAAESVYKELGLLETFGNMLRLPHSKALGISFLNSESVDLAIAFIIPFRGIK